MFLPVSSQGYQGSFQDGEGELLPDIVHSVRIRTAVGLCCWSLFGAETPVCLKHSDALVPTRWYVATLKVVWLVIGSTTISSNML